MFAPYRLNRLLLAGLAACAVTWAMAAGAFALPVNPPSRAESTGDRPDYTFAPGDVKEPETASRPDFTFAPGDVKEPQSGSRPEFTYAPGDVKSDADRARAVPPVTPNTPVNVPAPASDDTSTVALIRSIAAIVAALGAVTHTVTRTPRGAARA